VAHKPTQPQPSHRRFWTPPVCPPRRRCQPELYRNAVSCEAVGCLVKKTGEEFSRCQVWKAAHYQSWLVERARTVNAMQANVPLYARPCCTHSCRTSVRPQCLSPALKSFPTSRVNTHPRTCGTRMISRRKPISVRAILSAPILRYLYRAHPTTRMLE
jgi:hypothetical protein